ncbi:aminopeptidase N [Nesterenkonia flava]|uniref:Aminopeptidase N n=1 Tax=Nesterenkonia flava TaxID=469799 RepID=A0ABU1FTD5_9MICC|nr:aminopeptidase N [Nesterenkonia flava]MDR5711925.1 aminopeptidase N [Nesterenkonia flava]
MPESTSQPSATVSQLNITAEEAAARAALLSVSDYEIHLDLTGDAATFGSRTRVQFQARGSQQERAAGTWIDVVADEITEITLNGQPLDPELVYDGARISLPFLQEENTLVVDARMLYSSTGEGLHRFTDPVDGETYLYSQFEVPDSRRVYTVFEQPDLKARFTFSVTAPAHWRVISNSPTPAPQTSGATAVWDFAPTEILSSYVTAIIAGPYQGVESSLTSSDGRKIPLGIYARASLAEHLDAENLLTVTREGFAFFEEQFGRPYPFTKYDQIFVPDFNAGAMENAGAVTFLEDYVFRSAVPQAMHHARAITVLHELAHMWFGDLVTMRWWNDLWLNESFAEFTSTLAAAEGTKEFTEAWTAFAALEKNWAYKQDQLSSTHPIMAEIRDLDDVAVNFDGITYAKGASVLRQLVAWVGQENFFAGVRSYFSEFAWSNTELSDLMRHLSAASGRDLEAWTEAWLQSSGVNTLAVEAQSDDGILTSLQIRQLPDEADGLLRPHRVKLGIYDADDAGNLVRIAEQELDVEGEITDVPALVGTSRGALILPNDGDLAYCRIRLDAASADTAKARLSSITDPLARTLLWTSFWEAVRDGLLPASEFLGLIAEHLHVETDSSVLRTLLRQVGTALNLYVAPENAHTAKTGTSSVLRALLEQAEPGSDRQLQYLKALFTHATSEQGEFLRGLLSGGVVLQGRSIDTDLRWELLTALASLGEGDVESLVEEAAAADATASGHLARIEALAARPEEAVKAETWRRLMVEQSFTNSEQRRAIAGFRRVQERSLLRGYTREFFERIPGVWAGASKELALTLAVQLFPTWDVSPETLQQAEETIAAVGQEHPSLARMLGEGRDELARALRAQATDAQHARA